MWHIDAVVLDISPDSVDSHKKFTDKYRLPFPLLADTDKTVVQAYGVGKFMGVARTSFLIHPDGAIAKIYEDVKPKTHAEEVLADMKL